jgi:hypothetical protein
MRSHHIISEEIEREVQDILANGLPPRVIPTGYEARYEALDKLQLVDLPAFTEELRKLTHKERDDYITYSM